MAQPTGLEYCKVSLTPPILYPCLHQSLTNKTESLQKLDPTAEIHWVEEASGVLAGGTPGRICRITIAESLAHPSGHIEHFPAAGYGLHADGSEPRFPSKKEAKRFAAKCAVDWLGAQGLVPQGLLPLATSTPSPVPITPMQLAGHGRDSGSSSSSSVVVVPAPAPGTPSSSKRATQGSNNTISPPPKRQTTGEASVPVPVANGGPPATELVSNLCRELGITAPKYIISLSDLGGGLYNGRADFEHFGDKELLDLGNGSIVVAVLGKDNAKKRVDEL